MSIEAAAFQLIRGGVVCTDLATIQLSDGKCTYCVFVTTLGFLSDVCMEAERWRSFGLRFTRYYIGMCCIYCRASKLNSRVSVLSKISNLKGPGKAEKDRGEGEKEEGRRREERDRVRERISVFSYDIVTKKLISLLLLLFTTW